METSREVEMRSVGPSQYVLHALGLLTLFSASIGVYSVTADNSFVIATMGLAVIGHLVSLYIRKSHINSRLIEYTVFAICLVVYLRMMLTPYEAMVLRPGADSPQIKFAILLVWMEVLRSFTLTSDEAALFTSVTALAALGLVATDNVNPEMMGYFLIYVFATTSMLTNYSLSRFHGKASQQASSKLNLAQFRSALVVSLLALCLGSIVALPIKIVVGSAFRYAIPAIPPGGPFHFAAASHADDSVKVMEGPVRLSSREV
jgi:hypothetical protein